MKTLKRLLQENYHISNKEYLLLEELVTSKQLDKLLTFEKIDKKDAINIILSDEYNNGKDLDIYSYEDAEEGLFLFNKVNAYKIKYKDKLVGVFGFTLLKDYFKSGTKYHEGRRGHLPHLETLFYCIYHDLDELKKVNERLILSKNPKQHAPTRYNYLFKDIFNKDDDPYYRKDIFFKDVCRKSAYISFLQISTEAKEKYEISPMALILTFYKKLEHFLLENDVKLMIAHGINQKTTNKYVKVGKFENPVDLFKYWYQNSEKYSHCVYVASDETDRDKRFATYYKKCNDLFKHFVIKRID
jgi:hypothetical protein